MKNYLKNLFLIFPFFACTTPSTTNNLDKEKLRAFNLFSAKLKTLDLDSIREISTNKGVESLMSWSDSLRQKTFIKCLSTDLANEGQGVFDYLEWDSVTFAISMGNQILLLVLRMVI